MGIENHKNVEKIIRYYLLFLPPRGCKSILNIGCGLSDPYGGVLKTRSENYGALDIRSAPNVDYVLDVCDMKIFKDKEWEYGWCVETLEHILPELKEKAVKEIMRVCKNCIFTYPTINFEKFYTDVGHTEVKIDWLKLFGETHNIIDKTTKTGRAIIIVKSKNYIDSVVKNLQKGICDFE